MTPDEVPAWLRPHLPVAAPRDATRTRNPRPTIQLPTSLTPDVQRRINNLSATMGRTVGPATPGNHPTSALDIAALLTKPLHDLVNFGTGGALDNMRTVAAAARGDIPQPKSAGLLDDNNQITPEARDAFSRNLAMLTPGASTAKKVARDLVPEGTQFFDHYSDADLSGGMLEAQYAGTGLPGREAQRTNRPDMMHVYAAGARPEPQFRNMPRYRVAVTNPKGVYDASNDADGIVAQFRKQSQKSGKPFDFNGMENAIGKAGYAGYHGEDPEVVKLFGDNPVVPHGERFNIPPQRAVADSVAPSLIGSMSLEDMRAALARQRTALDRPTARPAAPSLNSTTTDGLADARRLLRTMQHNSGAVNMPRVTAVDPEKAAHMAQVYAGLPAHDPAAASAYDALNKEVGQQFQSILDNGHRIEFTDTDPYKTSKEMIADIRDNRRLKVFKTPGESAHPFMTADQNDKFRAVHDWLAHAGEGHSFGPVGEENAYRVHASTLSPEAQQALATETRGQNSWVNFGPNSHLPPAQRPFAEQKAALWPAELTGDYHEMPTVAPNSVVADSVAAQVPAFYSRLGNAIQNAPMKKGTSAQWLAHLSKNVSADERDWTGVDKFLKSTTGPVTQDQVQQVFDAGKIKLGRRTLSTGTSGFTVRRNPNVAEGRVGAYDILDPDGNVVHHNDSQAKPKFAQYTEPGGTNYRENLTTLKTAVPTRQDMLDKYGTDWRNHITPAEDLAISGDAQPFRSSHFDEPNVLLHTRTKDRELPDGSKVLHAEEIQSDWHQQGRSKGYMAPPSDADHAALTAARARLDNADAAYEAYSNSFGQDRGLRRFTPEYRDAFFADPETQRLTREMDDAHMAHDTMLRKGSKGVPNAPFKKTEDWQLLGIKQLIDDAVRGGYDHVAWTPGQMQADRYDLSNTVGSISYHPESGTLEVSGLRGGPLHRGIYDPKALPSVIGKEATDKLLASPIDDSGFHDIEGDDMKFGGSGMKSFYDQMLPKNLNKYFKSLNLGDMGTPQLGTTEMQFNKPGELSVQQMPSFPITPALRQMVLTKGQPLLGGLLGALGLGAYGAYGASGAAQGDNSPQQY